MNVRTLDERYSSAMHSSDLSPVVSRRVDVDYLIAAGCVRETLGTALYRLASEWDLAAGDYKLAMRHVRDVELQAAHVQRTARRREGDEADRLDEEAGKLLAQARAEALTAKALAMVHLKTLREAADALGAFAIGAATRMKFMRPDAEVLELAGKALNLWLDGTCSSCSGRGFNGGFGIPKAMCTACGGTGRAHWQLPKSEPNAAFILGLLSEMDRKVMAVERRMSRLLRSNPYPG